MELREFDYEKSKHVLESYALSTELTCRLINHEGLTLLALNEDTSLFNYLNFNMDRLTESYLYGANQASIYGGTYVYFGPFGLVYYTTPIVKDKVILGAFVVGPLLMTEPDQYLIEHMMTLTSDDNLNINILKYEVMKLKVIEPKRVKAQADLLLICSHYINEDAYVQFEKDKDQLEQNSEIATYMSHLKTMGGDTLEGVAYPIEKEKELMNLISIGDQEGSNRVLNEIMAHIYIGYGMNFGLLKSRVLELVVLLSRAALEGGAQAEEIFGLNYSYLNEIHEFDQVDQLTKWLARISKRFTETVFRFGEAKHQDAIYKAFDYIKHNYMNKITMEEVAEYVYFSGPYFSRIFKKETGITFNKYLNKVRITASKQLIKEKDMSLADIADAVGYHDQSHFSRMFKSIVGTSPKKFSETL